MGRGSDVLWVATGAPEVADTETAGGRLRQGPGDRSCRCGLGPPLELVPVRRAAFGLPVNGVAIVGLQRRSSPDSRRSLRAC
ncbi:hypothetical protein [Streptomyces sp. NPDC048590]|uniref:hypothetical protein n=1 Tax=Streptomyces sp. NPDC048590 TaxID=3365574 RepID=UPI00371250DF